MCFFFNNTATTEIYTLSLHDALPISAADPEPDPVLHPTEPTVSQGEAAGAVTVGVEDVADGQQVTIGAPDRAGLVSGLAGVLALNQPDVRAAKGNAAGGRATAASAVRPRFGRA